MNKRPGAPGKLSTEYLHMKFNPQLSWVSPKTGETIQITAMWRGLYGVHATVLRDGKSRMWINGPNNWSLMPVDYSYQNAKPMNLRPETLALLAGAIPAMDAHDAADKIERDAQRAENARLAEIHAWDTRLTRAKYEAEAGSAAMPDSDLGPPPEWMDGTAPSTIHNRRYCAYSLECERDGRSTEFDTRELARIAAENAVKQAAAARRAEAAAVQADRAARAAAAPTVKTATIGCGYSTVPCAGDLYGEFVVKSVLSTRRPNRRDDDNDDSNGDDLLATVELTTLTP